MKSQKCHLVLELQLVINQESKGYSKLWLCHSFVNIVMNKSPYILLKEKSQIIIKSSLEIIKLNPIAYEIAQLYINNVSIENIIQLLLLEYEVSQSELSEDVKETILNLNNIGIVPIQKNDKLNETKKIQSNLKTPIVHIIQNCNSPCKTCDCWKTKGRIFHSVEKLKNIFVKIKELGAESVMISGGEPLLHPELREIIVLLKELKLKVMLNTNGINLHLHSYLQDLEIDQLVISMDASDQDSYRMIRGINKYDQVWQNIADFIRNSANSEVGIRITLNRFNLEKLYEIILKCRTYGIKGVGFSPLDVNSSSFSRSEMNPEREHQLKNIFLPTTNQIDQFLSEFKKGNEFYDFFNIEAQSGLLSWNCDKLISCLLFYKKILISKSDSYGNDPCVFPYISMIIDYNGDLKSCFYSMPFGNIDNLSEAKWELSHRIEELKQSKICSTCRGRVFCDESNFT